MGSEFGQWSEWYCKTSLDWHLPEHDTQHKQLQDFVRALNIMYLDNPSLWQVDFSFDGFRWLDFNDVDNSVIGFARIGFEHDDHLVCVFNFTPQVIYNYKMGVPAGVSYQEIFNSDSHAYGGSNVLNINELDTVHEPFGFAPYHVKLNLPPLGGIILKPLYK
jgi:1,4-alpha-glucan branching enzyme